MRITVDVTPEVEKWLNDKVQSGSINSPHEYVNAALERDYLEEQIMESLVEPATSLTSEDWARVRREVKNSGKLPAFALFESLDSTSI
jgi:Arc/MetJ-type ribon-helix-helix transcriptional regulator